MRVLRWHRWLVALLQAAAALLLPAFAHAESGPPIRVGVYNFPPLVQLGPRGEAQGLYIDLLEHVAREEGWQLEYVPGSWEECLRRLRAGEIDLQPVVGYSEQRTATLDYGAEVPVLDWGAVFTRDGSEVKNVFDLRGKRIGALKGSIYTAGFRTLLEQFAIEATFVEKDEYREVFRAVAAGEVDAGINSQLSGAHLASDYRLEATQIFFAPVKLLFAAPKGRSSAVLHAIDAHLVALRKDRGSIWYELLDRWVEPAQRRAILPRWIGAVGAALGAILLLSLAFVLALRRQVAAKTRDLTLANEQLREGERQLHAALSDLRASEERYRKVSELTADVMACYAVPPGAEPVLEWSAGSLQLVEGGVSAEEFLVADREGASPELAARRARLGQLALDGEGYVHEYRALGKDGRDRWLGESGRAERDEAGRVVRIYVATSDVTDHRVLEEQLLQAQKVEAVGRLAGGVAHDLNNLLTPILAYAGLLRDAFPSGDERREFVEEVARAGLRAKELIQQLLAFGRKQALRPRATDLNAVVVAFERLLRRTLREDITLALTLAPALPPVMTDVTQLEQVIMNLCVNAQDAMPAGGRLTIETHDVLLDDEYAARHRSVRPGRYVLLAVTDTGHGMDAETTDRIFEPFFTTKEKGKGTGLGLATVYGIVRQHGGHIWAYSEPGKGASFKIYLPVAADVLPAEPATEPVPQEEGGTETVMVAEDNDMVRNLAVVVLRRLGYRVLSAARGEDCLRMIDGGERIDLLLTDVVMPGMNGRLLFEKVAARCPGVKVLYMSGYTDNVIVHHGVLEEGLAFIQKPFSVQALGARVREVLSSR